MRRRLAATLAVVALAGVAVAVLLSVIDGGEGTAAPRAAQPADAQPAPGATAQAKPAKPRAIHFPVSASGDLLMHQPLRWIEAASPVGVLKTG